MSATNVPEQLLVAGPDGEVDHALADPDERDRRRLRQRREDDRDGERPAVGAQEPEQTGERVQVRVLRYVHR